MYEDEFWKVGKNHYSGVWVELGEVNVSLKGGGA